MGIDATMAYLYAQAGLAAPLAQSMAVASATSHAASRRTAQEQAMQERKQIQKTDKSAGNPAVDVSEDRSRGGGDWQSSRRRKRSPAPEETDAAFSPFVGNFLNVKV